MLQQEIGIDLGTSNTLLVARRRGIIAREPSVVAIHRKTQTILAVGAEAHRMIGRTPDSILPVHPVQGGMISNLNYSTALLKHMIRGMSRSRWLRPTVLLTIPSHASALDGRIMAEAAIQAGAGEVYVVAEALAAGLGAGLPVAKPVGSLLVDIGSGCTTVSVLSLGGVVLAETASAAGDQMDEAIARYLKKEHSLLIGMPTAERLKIRYGAALPGTNEAVSVTGRLLTTGSPTRLSIGVKEIHHALSDTLAQIDAAVRKVLERTPPELLADISKCGIVLTGGGSLLHGMDTRLRQLTGLPARVAAVPMDAVALGTELLLEKQPRIKLVKVKP